MDYVYSSSMVDYQFALNTMEEYINQIYNNIRNSTIWFLEHDSIYTCGISGNADDILNKKLPVYQTNRGGKITYHGPGQRIVYFMINLKSLFMTADIHAFIKSVEDILIEVFDDIGVQTYACRENIGIWTKDVNKLVSLGLRIRKWITYHGVAINIATDLSHFDNIIPCGLRDKKVTSLIQMGVNIKPNELDQAIFNTFCKKFNCELGNRYEIN